MVDVTSGLLSANTAARFQLTAERFPVGKSATSRDDDDDWTKTGVSSSSSETEDLRPASNDLSGTTLTNEQVYPVSCLHPYKEMFNL